MNGVGDILENTISYLYKISEALPVNLSIPKSYYASKSRILELKSGSVLPAELTRDRVRCPRCCLNFSDYPPKVHLKSKPKRERFARKMLKKIEERKPLTNYQRKFRKMLLKTPNNNVLVNTCQFCRKEILRNVKFQEDKIKKKPDLHTPVISRKKKKKKKDKFAGLTPNAVITLDDTLETKEEETNKKNSKQTLYDILQKVNDEKIKYNVVGNINGKNKKKKNKNRAVKEPAISAKSKTIQKKENKANQKQKGKIKNLLDGLNKPQASNVLCSFLETL